MRKLCWIALQTAIVAGTVWLEYDRSATEGGSNNVGVAFGLGIFLAVIVTAGLVVAEEKLRWLIGLVSRRSSQRVVDVAVIPSEIGQAQNAADRLGTAGGSQRQLSEPLRRLGSGEQAR
jgi:hypothetical protein